VRALLDALEAAERSIEIRDHIIQQHAEAGAIFQSGGKYHAAADLPLGSSCVVGGIKWLDEQVTALRQQLAEGAPLGQALFNDMTATITTLRQQLAEATQREAALRAEKEGWRTAATMLNDALVKACAAKEAAEQRAARLEAALENLAIEGVTAGANPQRDGTMSPPLWHMSCRLCGARWSKQQKKQPREHPAHTSQFTLECPLAARASLAPTGDER
jgi:hypothetical protein